MRKAKLAAVAARRWGLALLPRRARPAQTIKIGFITSYSGLKRQTSGPTWSAAHACT